jgi:hypothetical protein
LKSTAAFYPVFVSEGLIRSTTNDMADGYQT